MSSVEGKMVFYTNLEYLGREIRNHRDSIINRDLLFTDYCSINDMATSIKKFREKINTLKGKINFKDLKDDVNKYLSSEISYLDNITDALKVILKNINNNVHSEDFIMENDLLYQTALISKISSDVDNLEKNALYYSFFTPKGDGVTIIDGRSIKTEDVSKYEYLSKYLSCAKNRYDSLENAIDNLNINNEDHKFIPFSSQSMIESDIARIDEILRGSGRKKSINLFGECYYVPRRDVKEFKLLMVRVNKYSKSQDNSIPYVINNPLFSNIADRAIVVKKDNRKCIGKISGGIKFTDMDSLEKRDTSKYNYIGKIGIIEDNNSQSSDFDNTDEVVVYNMGKDPSKRHKFGENKKNRINILDRRKSNDIKKIRKGILTASVAVVMSFVTAISVFGLSRFSFGKKDDFAVNNSVMSINNDDKKLNLSFSNLEDNIISRTMNDSHSDALYGDLKQEIISEMSSNNSFEDTNVVSRESVTDSEEVNEQRIGLNDEIIISDDAAIYSNCIDASNKFDGLDPYFDSDVTRTVRGVAFKSNDSVVYTYSQEDYNYWVDSGAEISAVCCDDGFYNASDIITANKTLIR